MTQSEKQFQQAVIDFAILKGWKYYHTYNSRRSVPGFPDLVLVRERVIFVELKREGGKLTEAQHEWCAAISHAKNGEVYIWRPSDWPEIERVLS